MYFSSQILLLSASSLCVQTVIGRNVIDLNDYNDEGRIQCTSDYKSEECQNAINGIQCDAEYLNEASASPSDRWRVSLCEFQWLNVTDAWKSEKEHLLPFPRWVNNQFHGRDNMDCQTLADKNGCEANHLCQDLAQAGQFFILNSFATINRMLWNYYDGVYNAQTDVDSVIADIAKSFSPMEKALSIAEIIDFVMLGYVVSAAPFFNFYTKRLPAITNFEGGDLNGYIKDTVNGVIANGLTLTKDMTRSEAQNVAEKNLLAWTGKTVRLWAESTSNYAKSLFSGDDHSIVALTNLLANGGMAATPIDEQGQDELSAEGIKRNVKKALYADLIPRAWRLSNLPLGPFILKSNKNCDGSKIEYISDASREKFGVCINGEMWVLTSAPDPEKHCQYYGDYYSCLEDFQDLPGADQLNGQNWAGLTVEDIVRGSVATWDMHGHANKGKTSLSEDSRVASDMESYADPNAENPGSSFFENVRNDGVRAPGIIDIPVCDVDEAVSNWEEAFGTLGFKPWSTYPCNKV